MNEERSSDAVIVKKRIKALKGIPIPTDKINKMVRLYFSCYLTKNTEPIRKQIRQLSENGESSYTYKIDTKRGNEKMNTEEATVTVKFSTKDGRPLTDLFLAEDESLIMSAIWALSNEGTAEDNIVTAKQIYKRGTGREANDDEQKRISEIIDRLSNVTVSIDNTSECKTHKFRTPFVREAPMIDAEKIPIRIKGLKNGKDIQAYRIINPPILTDYAVKTQQYVEVPITAIQAAGRQAARRHSHGKTSERLIEFTGQTVKIFNDDGKTGNKEQRYISYDLLSNSIFPAEEQKNKSKDALKKDKQRIKKKFLDILEELKQNEVITDYKDSPKESKIYITPKS